MKTTVSHKGTKRSVTDLPIENWDKHREVIIAWCDGADVEDNASGRWIVGTPGFGSGVDYRIAQRKPQPGEVWRTPDAEEFYLVTDNLFFIRIDNCTGNSYAGVTGAVYYTPSVKAYLARQLYKESLVFDGGFEYDDANKLLKVVKEAME